MLDTNAVSELIRNPSGGVAAKVLTTPQADIVLSSIVASELLFGVEKRGSARLAALIDQVFGKFVVLDYDFRAADTYSRVRNSLRLLGTPIGPLDTLIAAHALSLDATLVTHNMAEFGRVDGLKIKDWTRP